MDKTVYFSQSFWIDPEIPKNRKGRLIKGSLFYVYLYKKTTVM
jgi:hypothetical protein